MELVLGVDLGTSYFKLGLFDRHGKLHGLGRIAVETDSADGSHCELPIETFWSTLRRALQVALDQASAQTSDIVALAYSSQANSFVLLDESHQPLTPLILWPDRRVSDIDPYVSSLWHRADFSAVTGLGIDAGPECAIAKLKWFQTQCPGIWERTNRIMTISDYFTFALTGRPVGDAGTASLLGIVDVQQLCWWDEALDILSLSPEQMSSLLRPGALAGQVSDQGAARLGIPTGIPLALGGLDHHIAALGAGAGTLAPLSESTGTVLACLGLTDQFNPAGNICVGPGLGDADYYRFAFDDNGAGALEWYRQNHARHLEITELVAYAESVPAGCNGLVALPSAQKYPDLAGFENATPGHTPGHFARAIMESVAATLKKLSDDLFPQGRPARIVATGGGAKSDLWLQIKADLLGIEILRTQSQEPACQGAAMLAAIAAQWFDDLTEISELWTKTERVFAPNP